MNPGLLCGHQPQHQVQQRDLGAPRRPRGEHILNNLRSRVVPLQWNLYGQFSIREIEERTLEQERLCMVVQFRTMDIRAIVNLDLVDRSGQVNPVLHVDP